MTIYNPSEDLVSPHEANPSLDLSLVRLCDRVVKLFLAANCMLAVRIALMSPLNIDDLLALILRVILLRIRNHIRVSRRDIFFI